MKYKLFYSLAKYFYFVIVVEFCHFYGTAHTMNKLFAWIFSRFQKCEKFGSKLHYLNWNSGYINLLNVQQVCSFVSRFDSTRSELISWKRNSVLTLTTTTNIFMMMMMVMMTTTTTIIHDSGTGKMTILTIPRSEGSRGFIIVLNLHYKQVTSLFEYFFLNEQSVRLVLVMKMGCVVCEAQIEFLFTNLMSASLQRNTNDDKSNDALQFCNIVCSRKKKNRVCL